MSWYRRWRREGGLFFFTVVTYQRRKLFTNEKARTCLREAIERTRADRPFETLAIVLLPDHLHVVWRLPLGDADYSTRWRLIKSRFTRAWISGACVQSTHPTASHGRRGECAIWQRRFWEHMIRDADDLKRHVDYIHYNPVKHGLAETASAWPHSSFHRYVELGEYEEDWGQAEPAALKNWPTPRE